MPVTTMNYGLSVLANADTADHRRTIRTEAYSRTRHWPPAGWLAKAGLRPELNSIHPDS